MGSSRESEIFRDKIEVSLDGRQIFYLFFGGAVVATLVFVLGVMVGRRVEARSVAEVGGDVVSDPLAALDKLERGSELAFPSALRGGTEPLGEVDRTLAAATGGPSSRKPVDKPDSQKSEDKAQTSSDEAVKSPVEKKAHREERSAKPAQKEPANRAEDKGEADEAEPPKAERAKDSPRFTLQVGSFQQEPEAQALAQRLREADSSVAPKIVRADLPDKGTYYRVRVGGFPSFEAALEAKGAFENEHHIIAYVTRLK
jgi:hypothetical protein